MIKIIAPANWSLFGGVAKGNSPVNRLGSFANNARHWLEAFASGEVKAVKGWLIMAKP